MPGTLKGSCWNFCPKVVDWTPIPLLWAWESPIVHRPHFLAHPIYSNHWHKVQPNEYNCHQTFPEKPSLSLAQAKQTSCRDIYKEALHQTRPDSWLQQAVTVSPWDHLFPVPKNSLHAEHKDNSRWGTTLSPLENYSHTAISVPYARTLRPVSPPSYFRNPRNCWAVTMLTVKLLLEFWKFL